MSKDAFNSPPDCRELIGALLKHNGNGKLYVIVDAPVWLGDCDQWGYEHRAAGETGPKIVRPLSHLKGVMQNGEPRYTLPSLVSMALQAGIKVPDEGGTLGSLLLNKEAPFAERLRVLCGYVENASDTGVGVFQDDATRTWVVKVGSSGSPGGSRNYYGDSLEEAFEQAFQDPKNDPDA